MKVETLYRKVIILIAGSLAVVAVYLLPTLSHAQLQPPAGLPWHP